MEEKLFFMYLQCTFWVSLTNSFHKGFAICNCY